MPRRLVMLKKNVVFDIGKNLTKLLYIGGANEKYWGAFEEFQKFMKDDTIGGLSMEFISSEGGDCLDIHFRKKLFENGSPTVSTCPKCDGAKVDFSMPSPSAFPPNVEGTHGVIYHPPCLLCDGKGFVIVDDG
jgi:hypothetical protein